MSEILVRPATPEDLPAMIALLADDILGRDREDPSLPLAPSYGEAFAAITARPDHFLVVAVEGDEVVGTLQLTFIPGLQRKGAVRAIVDDVSVRSDRRSQGIGAQMIAWAADQARARGGCPYLQLISNKARLDAHRFYRRLGFDATSEGFKLKL